MDIKLNVKIAAFVFALIFDTNAASWSQDGEHESALDSLHDPSLSAIYDSFLPIERLHPISKRSSDWSKRQPRSSIPKTAEYKPEPQASENVEVSTKFPRVVRKMRLQNVPLASKQLDGRNEEKMGNDSLSTDQQGRIVRIKKFRRRTTTTKPTLATYAKVSTTRATTPITYTASKSTTSPTRTMTTTSPTRAKSTTFKPYTPRMEYAHITVINKEVRDQKPRRKNKNKKQASLWVPTPAFGERASDKERDTVTVSAYNNENDVKIHPTQKIYSRIPNKSEQVSSTKESRRVYDPTLQSENSQEPRNNQDRASKGNLETPNLHATKPKLRNPINPIGRENSQSSIEYVKQPAKTTEALHSNGRAAEGLAFSSNDTSESLPKSVEILSELSPTHQRAQESAGQNQQGLNSNAPALPENKDLSNPQLNQGVGRPFPNFGFQQFPQPGSLGFRTYPQDPFIQPPWAQAPQEPQAQNPNPLPPSSFQYQYSPFYGQNPQQFPDNYPNAPQNPYQRSGSLGIPGFHFSPQLASLRRSIMDVYADEDPVEVTTEFSIPKFEIPSIDFNDKGCRTVYKEVNAVPSGNPYRRSGLESKAKSVVMTRECFFPEGVPTRSPDEVKEQVRDAISEVEETKIREKSLRE